RPRLASEILEVIVGVQILVAEELPSPGMEILDAGLDHQCHGAGGRQSVVRTVVRGELTEFGDGFDRGHNADGASAAAVQVFPTINQVQVVGHALAVETNIGVCADRGCYLVVRHGAGSAGRQSGQRVNAATVSSNLGDLISRDQVADLAALGLDGNRGCFHGYALRGVADFQLEIYAGAIAIA